MTQPWAWMVASGDKDVENRRWTTSYRGPFLVHAAMGMSERDYLDAWEWVESRFGRVVRDRIPARDALVRGAIVGRAVIVDVVPPDLGMDCPDQWHMGAQHGFRLHDRSAIPVPVHHRGGLGLRKLDLAKAEAMWPGTREWARRATASVVRPGLGEFAARYLEEESQRVKVWCCCTDEERSKFRQGVDEDGLCFNCGKARE